MNCYMILLEWHGLIQWQKNLMDALKENVSLSLFIEFWKSLFATLDAAPSIIAHFQFIIEKISDKHKRPSAGKAIVQHNRNSKGTRKQEETKVPLEIHQTQECILALQQILHSFNT